MHGRLPTVLSDGLLSKIGTTYGVLVHIPLLNHVRLYALRVEGFSGVWVRELGHRISHNVQSVTLPKHRLRVRSIVVGVPPIFRGKTFTAGIVLLFFGLRPLSAVETPQKFPFSR